MTKNLVSARSILHRGSAVLTLCAMALLAACGGGGGSSGSTTPPPPTPVAPSITTQPANQTVNDGASASFTVAASGDATLSYQWKKAGTNVGTDSNTYTTPALSLADSSASYTVTVTNSAGSVTSNAATVTVNAVAPTITTQPTNQTAVDGASATFSVVADGGSSTLTYQWKRGVTDIAGATNDHYTTHALTVVDDAASYTVDVSNAAGLVTSNTVTLTVTALPPTIITQPAAQAVNEGTTATFTVVATAGSSDLHYQWKNGSTAVGTDITSYTTPVLQRSDNGNGYTVVVSDTAGSVTSNAAVLTVNSILLVPTITTQPTNQSAQVGATATFNVTATGGTPGLTYQWKKGTTNVGTNLSSYTTPALTPTDDGNAYTVTVTNSDGSVTSTSARLTVTHTLALYAGGIGGVGNTDGTGAAAAFHYPAGVGIDASGTVYVADTTSQTIRKITTPAGVTTTFAGTPNVAGYVDATGTSAQFNNPRGAAVSNAAGSLGTVYVADTGNHRIRKITTGGAVSTFAGSGIAGLTNATGTAAQFNSPAGVAVDTVGNVYVADRGNNVIRKIDPSGVVTTLAGSGVAGSANGTGAAAQFNGPTGVAVDAAGTVYVTDWLNTVIRQITSGGVVTTLAGTVGAYGQVDDPTGAGTAQFRGPTGLSLDTAGDNLFVADYENNAIRQVTTGAHGGTVAAVTTLAGSTTGVSGSANGTGTAATFVAPAATVVDSAGNVYVADLSNNLIRKITSAGVVTTLAGNVGGRGFQNGLAANAKFNDAASVASDSLGNVYVADFHNNAIRKVDTNGNVTTFAGTGVPGFLDGAGASAQFNGPNGVAVDASDNVYVADSNNGRIRKIASSGLVSTYAGSGAVGSTDATGTAASFYHPYSVATDAGGNVYVADFDNNTVRKIAPGAVVTTLAGDATQPANNVNGTGANALFYGPRGVATDSAGNVYVAELGNNQVRKITPAGVVTTLAGNGAAGSTDATGAAALFNAPSGVAVDAANNVYVADYLNHTIRRITQPGRVVTTLAGSSTSVGVTPGIVTAPVALPGSLNGPTGVAVLRPAGAITKLVVAEDTENAVLLITLP